MDDATAIQLASAARASFDVPPTFFPARAQRRIIELSEPLDGRDARVRDALVWIVRFQRGVAWAELAVEDATGAVVRLQKSRGR